MAIKGLKIEDSIANPHGGTALTTTFVCIKSVELVWNTDKSVHVLVEYFRNEADCDAGKQPLQGLTNRFALTVVEADFDDATKSPNDRIIEALKTELELTYTTVTSINKA